VRARTEGSSAADVDACLGGDERSLLIAWLNRGTLHLVRAEDYPWLHAVTTPPLLNESLRRLAVEDVSEDAAEKALAALERALGEDGPQSGPELRRRLEAEGHPVAGQAFFHLCFRAGVLGILVRGPMIGKQHAYVLARDWLGESPAVDRDAALAELGRRYLVGHAPASDRDLARWAGLPLRDARAGLAAVAAEIEERDDGLLQLKGQKLEGAKLAPPRLLGAFDPVLLGWTSREEITGRHTELITTNGLFRPFAMVDGKAVATWRWVKGKVAIEPLTRIAKRDRAVLDADAEDVVRFLGAA
jgi:hypothetical protein